jgi:hypothetical protein
MAVFWVVAIVLMMEAASTSETSVNSYQSTRRNNPDDSHLRNLYAFLFLPIRATSLMNRYIPATSQCVDRYEVVTAGLQIILMSLPSIDFSG